MDRCSCLNTWRRGGRRRRLFYYRMFKGTLLSGVTDDAEWMASPRFSQFVDLIPCPSSPQVQLIIKNPDASERTL
ncbi:unnamed protein product [Angiostrongylus costaricensis]|uniref:Uncharacterized protein n=1 Tax=Angiostrongylus costaricensis TaxID=334426 RepID=A0A0R3PRQ1_ANGCS|nr:unnamed protein product [Angiostrongylus costaricensis]